MNQQASVSLLAALCGIARAALKSNLLSVIATIWLGCASIALGANHYVDPASPSPTAPYTSSATAAHTISAALGVSASGDAVYVAAGNYTLASQITIPGGVSLICLTGPATATINGNSVTRCVYMPNARSSLNGFTITGGKAQTGAGVYCVGGTVTNCVISSNQAVGDRPQGGGVYCDGGIVSLCTVNGNSCTSTNADQYSAFAEGGGIYAVNQSQIDHSTVNNNTLTGYYANGAGINANNGSVLNCTISGNTAYGHWYASGGGVYMTANVNGLVRNCLITGNNAHTDRGAYSANTASGGGLYFNSGGTLVSSTLSANSIDGDASYGGGVCYGSLFQNTIIYGNTVTARFNATGPNYYLNPSGAATFDHCCSTPLPSGTGNIASAPGFASGGYTLGTGSPCIDTGTNQTWMATATDLAGNARLANGTVDMGAYETLSRDASLASLVPSGGTLSPAFASGTTSYTDNVAKSALSFRVTPTVAQAGATVKVNGTTVASGSASSPMALSVGANPPVSIVVTAPDGTTTKTYTLTVTRASRDTSRDLNGDGNADIFFQNNAGQIAAWYLNGAGAVTSSAYLYTGGLGDWKVVGVADMNGDGNSDILFQNNAGQIAVWYLNGSGAATSTAYLYTAGLGDWRVVGVADLNGDGNPDLVFQNGVGQIAAWYLNGSGGTTSSAYLSTGGLGEWRIRGTADINGDGNADLLFQNNAGQIAVWYLNGSGGVTSSAYLNTGGLGDWKIAATADINGDGNADLIFQNNAGQIAVWYLNGSGGVTSSAYLYTGGLGDWRVH